MWSQGRVPFTLGVENYPSELRGFCLKSLNHVFSPTWEGPKGLCSSEAQTHSLGIALHVLLYKYHVLTYCATGAPSCAQTGHEHSALMNEISILIIETPESSLAPSTL